MPRRNPQRKQQIKIIKTQLAPAQSFPCVVSSKLWHLSPPFSSSSFLGFMFSPPLEYYHTTF
ncbi:hypothetical protein NC651_019620 [Populus alba x Populus x berolinensis]|nr:hypothetical protein NC651_019620 [Populus alba x Populus x berolinensis]